MKTFFYISALLLGINQFAHATIQTKVNPDKPSEVVMTTANGSSVFHCDYDITTTFTWNWNATNGGNYSMVMLPDGLQDGLNIYYEDYDSWNASGTGPYEDWQVVYRGNNPPDRQLIDNGTNSYWGFPWEMGSLSDSYDQPWGYLSKNSKVTIQLRTGGKFNSMLNNLFGLQANATGYRHLELSSYDYITPVLSGSYPISPTSIQVAGCYLDTNGVTYAAFPDNATVDITPQSAENYYSIAVSATKYKSHFTVFVDMPDPPPGRNLNDGDDYGHAWWKFTTDAPEDAVCKLISGNDRNFLSKEVGYYPTGTVVWYNLGIVNGALKVPETDSNKTVTKQYDIGFQNLISGLDYTKQLYFSPGKWDPLFHNCVHAAWFAGADAGIFLSPSSYPEEFGYEIQGIPY